MQRLGNGEGGSKVAGENQEGGGTGEEEEEEEEEDLFVFNDTIEGPRAPAGKPGRITQA
jgi:hypothetical protein